MPVAEIYERTTLRFEAVTVLDGALIGETPNPFGIAHDCVNTSGHHFIASCGDIVCCHCTKVVVR